jgi:lipopolysaccharide export system permease protein
MLKKLDKYILKKFMTTFFLSITLILLIFIVFDIKDKLSSFTSNHIPLREIIFDYYLPFIPYYGNFFSPLFVFISVIFFTSKMAQQTEFIAILSSGASFNRILRPYIIGAFLLSSASLVFNHFILPRAFKIKIGFEDKWINENYNSDAQNIHFKIGPNRLLYMEGYENRINTGFKMSLEDVVNNKQTYFLTADRMTWDSASAQWILTNVHERTIVIQDRLDTLKNQKPIYKRVTRFYPEKKVKLEFSPIDMWRDESKIETKPYTELKAYIAREKAKGSNRIALYEVELYKRTSFPFATFILTIIGVCVSSRKVRGGVGIQIALGLVLSCIYIMLQYVFITIATTDFMQPLLGVWIPNIVFSFVAFYFYRTAQK